MHKKLFNEEHEVNICKSDKEVYELLCKRKYLATKESIEKSEYAVTLFDDPKNLVYRGIKFYPYYDAYGRLDKKSSYVKVYDIHPFIHDAYLETAFELDELDKIHSIINSVADEIFDLRHDK